MFTPDPDTLRWAADMLAVDESADVDSWLRWEADNAEKLLARNT